MKGVAITIDPAEVQSVATEMTIAEYLQVVLLLDNKGNGVLLSPLEKETGDEGE